MKAAKPFRHMLAEDFEFAETTYPLYMSIKYDGVRYMVRDGQPISRQLKQMPNHFAREYLSDESLEGLDFEVVVGKPNLQETGRTSMSGIQAADGKPNFRCYVFDFYDMELPYHDRLQKLKALSKHWPCRVLLVEQKIVDRAFDAELMYMTVTGMGYEGVVGRKPDSMYKHGRSTLREGGLLRRKPTGTSEALILATAEELQNTNEAVRDARGLLKRTTHKANKIGKGYVGKLFCRDLKTGQEFWCAGLTQELKDEFTAESPVGKIMEYEFMDHGAKDAPRQPRFKLIRHKDTM